MPQNGQPLGSLEREEVSSKLPWPDGSDEKLKSFNQYQAQYKEAKAELDVSRPPLGTEGNR